YNASLTLQRWAMPRVPVYQRILNLHRRLNLPADFTMGQIVDIVDDLSVAEVVSAMPADLMGQLQITIGNSPTTDEEWDRRFSISSSCQGCGREPKADTKVSPSYRKGIEVLRQYFDSQECQ